MFDQQRIGGTQNTKLEKAKRKGIINPIAAISLAT